MAGISNLLDDENIQNLLKKVTDFNQGGGSGQYQLPPDILEALGAGPTNRARQGKITNKPDEEADKILKKLVLQSSSTGPISAESRKMGFALQKEKARALAARSKYYEATSLLEEIESTEEITELGIKLLMAECYLQLGRENKANKSIRGLRSVLLKNPTLDADEALGLVESLVENKSYTRALIMLPVVSELFQRLSSADDILEGLFRCIKKANDCTRPMISSGGRDRILALDFGMDYMVDTLKDLEGLNADPQKKAFKQCLATTLIAYDYWMLKENLKGVRLRERAVAAMDRAFGEAAKQRRIYGNSLYNIGVGYDILSKPNEAKAAYLKAIEAIELATDFDDESDRRRDLKMCQQKMKELYK